MTNLKFDTIIKFVHIFGEDDIRHGSSDVTITTKSLKIIYDNDGWIHFGGVGLNWSLPKSEVGTLEAYIK